VITEAAPSGDEQLRSRRRRYTALMVIHLVGLAVGGSLYESAWGLGLAILIITGPLQWVAVIIANDAPRRRRSPPRLFGPPTARAKLGPAFAAREQGQDDRHRSEEAHRHDHLWP
jgi:hypothetical protein